MNDFIFSEGVIQRISQYLRFLIELKDLGKRTVTSGDISENTKINSAEVRRDLINLGIKGKRGVGFSIDGLISNFNQILGHEANVKLILVGAGNLGKAILNYQILKKFGFDIEDVFDNNEKIIGTSISERKVQNIICLPEIISKKNIRVAILAVSQSSAQNVTDLLVKSGIKVIINYTSVSIEAPPGVNVQTNDPIEKLLHTLYYLSNTGQAF